MDRVEGRSRWRRLLGLSGGGSRDPGSESAQAAALLAKKFHRTDSEMLITLSSQDNVRSDPIRSGAVGWNRHHPTTQELLTCGSRSVAVGRAPQVDASLISTDAKSALIVADIVGGERDGPAYTKTLSNDLVRDRDGVIVRAGGSAAADTQVAGQTEKHQLLMEAIAIPVSLLVLIAASGGLLAAALPIFVSGLAIMGSMATLRAISFVADVSTFALKLAIAMGLALAINYTLLILSRYRDELAGGASRDQAVVYTMATAAHISRSPAPHRASPTSRKRS